VADSSRRFFAWLGCGLVCCALISMAILLGAQTKSSPSEAKAAFLLNFGKFLQFMPGTEPRGTSFDICILGQDTIGSSIDKAAAGVSINNRPVHVLRIPDITKGRVCAVLFISSSERNDLREDFAILGAVDVLTVSDLPDFLERGGMIQFVNEGDHVRFAVNLDQVNRTHLILSSDLLRVAALVKGRPASGARQ
jgi:hypothetical protein